MPSTTRPMLNKGNLGYKVSYRTYSWRELVVRQWGSDWGRPDIAYEFSNGHTANSSDQYKQGIYNPTSG